MIGLQLTLALAASGAALIAIRLGLSPVMRLSRMPNAAPDPPHGPDH